MFFFCGHRVQWSTQMFSYISPLSPSLFIPADSMMQTHGVKVLTPAPDVLVTHDLRPFTKRDISLDRAFPAGKNRLALLTQAFGGTIRGNTGGPSTWKTTLPGHSCIGESLDRNGYLLIPCLSPKVALIGSSPPATPNGIKR